MPKRSREELIKAHADYLQELKKTHKMRVMDLRVLRAIVPENAGESTRRLYAGLAKMPDYHCTCGAQFETKELADQHVKEKETTP